jgi:hypothetical protein
MCVVIQLIIPTFITTLVSLNLFIKIEGWD